MIKHAFEPVNMTLLDALIARDAQLTAKIKQMVLNFVEHLVHRRGHPLSQQQANDRIQLVGGPIGGNTITVLACARPVTKAC